MPIYEYACEKCGEQFEVTQKITALPLKRHNGPARCGGKLKKLMSSNAFHLKGTGWYKTDYADKEKKNISDRKAKSEVKTDEKKSSSDTSEKSTSETGEKKEKPGETSDKSAPSDSGARKEKAKADD